MAGNRIEQLAGRNLFAELVKLRDEQRERSKSAAIVVSADDLPKEVNPLGVVQWYLHPNIRDTALRTLIFWVQEIPPGSRSGRIKTQGGTVIYVWHGHGHTLIDQVRHSWAKGDVVQVPIRSQGVVAQHFNDSTSEPARLVCCEANVVESLGVDKGSGFEVLEACPEASNQ